MASTYRQQQLGILRANERDMTALFRGLHSEIAALLTGAAGADGRIPARAQQGVRNRAGELVTAFFLGPKGAPFEVVAGRVMPQSVYMAALWGRVEETTRVAVRQQAAIMLRYLRGADDVLRAFMRASVNPFVEARRQVQEQAYFRPRPFAQYDPLHRFVDSRGYTLSTRLWDTANVTRRKLDLYMAEMIAEGRGSLEIARGLEPFLMPGRSIVRTNKPYGTNASYDAMRLARTEITAAHHRAGLMAANANPFVQGYNVVVSGSHSIVDICDEAQAGGPYALDDMENLPPLHPHCMCAVHWALVESPADALDELRDPVPSGEVALVDIITPLLIERFVRLLLDEPIFEEVA